MGEANMKLLTRDEFREGVFARDGRRCVVRNSEGHRCPVTAADAHHIYERRLWGDTGGYYLDNGASVCELHHIECEQTLISADDLREWIGIDSNRRFVPEHLYPDQPYDKWGNPILPNGQRMKGELFDDESVQKILKPVLHLFTNKVKYPRTYHLPWSPGATKDDRVMADKDVKALLGFLDKEKLVMTIKMDGENTTMYRDGIHARSLEYESHPSRDWVKALHARIAHEIPETWRICGENLYARHSIHYKHLRNRFQVFSIWDGLRCLSWNDTVDYCKMLGLEVVPVIDTGYALGPSVKELGEILLSRPFEGDEVEGYVVRRYYEFQYGEFKKAVAKYVRANHVQTHGHWMRQHVVPNEVSGEKE